MCIRKERIGVSFILSALTFSVSGCTWLLELAASGRSRVGKEFELPSTGDLAGCVRSPVAQCVVPGAGDAPPSALSTRFENEWISTAAGDDANAKRREASAQAAIDALNHPVQQSINRLFNLASESTARASGDAAGKETPDEAPVEWSIQDVDDFVSTIERATADGSWDALADAVRASDAESARGKRQAAFLKAYFKAYFRDGEFVTIDIDATAAEAGVKAKLREQLPALPDAQAGELAKKLLRELEFENGKRTIGKLSTVGFVSRGGQSLQFPAVQVAVSVPSMNAELPKLEYVVLGNDLVRVFLHAIFDAHQGVPAVPNATGVENLKRIPDGLKPYDDKVFAVTLEEFGEVETRAGQVEAAAGAGIGRLIRGLGFLSLDNEALASVIETAIAVTLRKRTEKLLWCWYLCSENSAAADAGYLAGDPSRTTNVKVSITGLNKRLN